MEALTLLPIKEQLLFSKVFNFENVDLSESYNKISMNSCFGKGSIIINQFEEHFKSISVSLKTNKVLDLDVSFFNLDVFTFLFVTKGSCQVLLKTDDDFKTIDKLESISGFIKDHNLKTFRIKENSRFTCHIVYIGKDAFLDLYKSRIFKGQDEIMNLISKLETNVYKGDFSLDLVKELKKIKAINSDKSRLKLLKSKARNQLLLALHLDECCNKFTERNLPTGLSAAELKIINLVAAYIFDNPGSNHLQSKLCKRFFISQSKLQYGFKHVHKTTVTNFTKNVRLEKAERLLITSHLNVSEIVYAVGFTSRSYFSKIFKLSYGLSPTQYRLEYIKQKLLVLA